jgi:replication factor C subunit 3/5
MFQQEQRLWVEKYRPNTFQEAYGIHKDVISMLSNLSQSEDFPHILFYGPSGSGKRTLTKGLL